MSLALAACGKGDAPRPAEGSAAVAPTPPSAPVPPPPAPPAPPAIPTHVEGHYQVPAATMPAGLPVAPAAYVFVGPGDVLRFGTTPAVADAAPVADLEALRALHAPAAAGAPAVDDPGGLLGEVDAGFGLGMRGSGGDDGTVGTIGTVGNPRYGTIGHGSGTGWGYGRAPVRARLIATARRVALSPVRLVLVVDRATAPARLAQVLDVLDEEVAVVVDGGGGVPGALAFTLGLDGDPPPMARVEVKLDGEQVVLFDRALDQETVVPSAGAAGGVDRGALAQAVANVLPDPSGAAPRFEVLLPGATPFGTIVTILDGLAAIPGDVAVRVERPRAGSRAPQVRLGQPTVIGDLDKAIISRYIKRSLAKITHCYEQQLVVRPDLAGTLTAEFAIDLHGRVAFAKARGLDPAVARCAAAVLKTIEYPHGRHDAIVQVTYPFTFSAPFD